jgi:ribose transport system substrate-binding protein
MKYRWLLVKVLGLLGLIVAAGRKAADQIATLLGGAGKVALVRYQADSASTKEREAGFSDTLASKYPRIRIVADPRGATSVGAAYHTVAEMLDEYPQIEAIFSVNESMAQGTLKALGEAGLLGRIRFVGFDLNWAIKDATIAQNPFQIGYLGVKITHLLIQNKTVSAKFYTDTVLITGENIHTKTVRKIVQPNTGPIP